MAHATAAIHYARPADARAVRALLQSFRHTYLRAPTPADTAAFFATISEGAIHALLARTDMTYILAVASGTDPLAGAGAVRAAGLLFPPARALVQPATGARAHAVAISVRPGASGRTLRCIRRPREPQCVPVYERIGIKPARSPPPIGRPLGTDAARAALGCAPGWPMRTGGPRAESAAGDAQRDRGLTYTV